MRLLFFTAFLILNITEAKAQEGVSTEINPARLNEVMEWVENAKYSLDTGLDNIQRSGVADQEVRYESLIDTILRQSGDKPNEFLMRNILHRTKVVYQSFKQIPSSPKRDVLARRILEKGVTWAQELYQPDLNLMKLAREGRLTEVLRGTEFAKIGVQWADYMLSLYYLAPTNSIKLQIMKDMMGLMYNDINNDDAVKRILAPISGAVVLKNDELQRLNPRTNLEKLRVARDLRRFMEQQIEMVRSMLNIHRVSSVDTIQVERDERIAVATATNNRATRYETYYSNGCAAGFVQGSYIEGSNIECLKISSTNKYQTYYSNGCATGFVQGLYSEGSNIQCLRKSSISKYKTYYSNGCAEGFVQGRYVNGSNIECLRI